LAENKKFAAAPQKNKNAAAPQKQKLHLEKTRAARSFAFVCRLWQT
jgi:hypothetical protein